MPTPDPSRWSVSYDDPRSSARMLISLPTQMLDDLRLLAQAREISLSELVRQVMSRELAGS